MPKSARSRRRCPLATPASMRAKRITAPGKHLALSAPIHTTQRDTRAAAASGGGEFDFAHAATLLTDAAARAGAAIMRHYREGAGGRAEGRCEPRDPSRSQDSEAIILAALQRLAPEIPVVSEEAADDRTAELRAPLLSRRSPRRHQGVHQQAHRLHRQRRADRGRHAPLRPRLCAGPRAARAYARGRRSRRGRARTE